MTVTDAAPSIPLRYFWGGDPPYLGRCIVITFMGFEINPATIRTHSGSAVFRVGIVGDAYDGWGVIGRNQKDIFFGNGALDAIIQTFGRIVMNGTADDDTLRQTGQSVGVLQLTRLSNCSMANDFRVFCKDLRHGMGWRDLPSLEL
ncbi:hypothetical protein SAMN05443582_104278 [Phyllobacterium sp. OV277]|nr:hypothetical protein SAMN05443582_104278 [Phyllobacterium sp. OV277]